MYTIPYSLAFFLSWICYNSMRNASSDLAYRLPSIQLLNIIHFVPQINFIMPRLSHWRISPSRLPRLLAAISISFDHSATLLSRWDFLCLACPHRSRAASSSSESLKLCALMPIMDIVVSTLWAISQLVFLIRCGQGPLSFLRMPMQVKLARSGSDKASRCRILSGFHRLDAIEN